MKNEKFAYALLSIERGGWRILYTRIGFFGRPIKRTRAGDATRLSTTSLPATARARRPCTVFVFEHWDPFAVSTTVTTTTTTTRATLKKEKNSTDIGRIQ